MRGQRRRRRRPRSSTSQTESTRLTSAYRQRRPPSRDHASRGNRPSECRPPRAAQSVPSGPAARLSIPGSQKSSRPDPGPRDATVRGDQVDPPVAGSVAVLGVGERHGHDVPSDAGWLLDPRLTAVGRVEDRPRPPTAPPCWPSTKTRSETACLGRLMLDGPTWSHRQRCRGSRRRSRGWSRRVRSLAHRRPSRASRRRTPPSQRHRRRAGTRCQLTPASAEA